MHDLLETVAICYALGMVFTPLVAFLLFLRYINRKEKAALAEIQGQQSN